jgi:hypothetical protein
MPKYQTKFIPAMQAEFQFLKPVSGSESKVLCALCNAKIDISVGGRLYITKHVETQKHIKASMTLKSNQRMTSFLSNDPAVDLLRGKELTLAYHSAKHKISTRTTDCNSKLISKLFEPKLTCGATKSSKLIQQVSLVL